MSVKTEHRSETKRASPDHRDAKFLVVGREGALALCGLLSRLLRWRKLPVEETVSFDHGRGLTLYEIKVPGPSTTDIDEVDLMICLSLVGRGVVVFATIFLLYRLDLGTGLLKRRVNLLEIGWEKDETP